MYMKIGMFIFEELCSKMPLLEMNRETFEEIVSQLASQHLLVIKDNEGIKNIDYIFFEEVARYYNAITGIAQESLLEILNKQFPQNNHPTEAEEDRIVVYSTLGYKRDKNGVLHIPTLTLFLVQSNNNIVNLNKKRGIKPLSIEKIREYSDFSEYYDVLVGGSAETEITKQ